MIFFYIILFLPAMSDIIIGIYTLDKFCLVCNEYCFVMLKIINGFFKIFTVIYNDYFYTYEILFFYLQHIILFKKVYSLKTIKINCNDINEDKCLTKTWKIIQECFFFFIIFIFSMIFRKQNIIHILLIVMNIKFAFTVLIQQSRKKSPFEMFFIFYIIFALNYISNVIFHFKILHIVSDIMFSYANMYLIITSCFHRQLNEGYSFIILQNQFNLPYFI